MSQKAENRLALQKFRGHKWLILCTDYLINIFDKDLGRGCLLVLPLAPFFENKFITMGYFTIRMSTHTSIWVAYIYSAYHIGSEDKVARLWSTMTDECECIGILQGHEDYITCILMEDNYVVTGSADKTIRKWDICTCDCVLIFEGHGSPVNRIICTGDFIFSSSYDRTARCWDFDSAECVRIFTGHKRGVYPMVFIPADEEDVNVDTFDWEGNKDILITGSADFTARSWSFETGKTLKIFKGHTGSITCMGTDPAGHILYTGSTDSTIKSWNIAKGENLKTFEGHSASVLCMTVCHCNDSLTCKFCLLR